MQQRTVINKGKKYIVNVATWEDGIGAGFAVGQLVLKSIDDGLWYIVTTSGTPTSVVTEVSQSALSFPTSSYFDQNYPYQLVAADNGLSYYVYLESTAPTAALVISQSAYTGSAEAKPHLLLQNITDGNYYQAYLHDSSGTITLEVNQTMISQSWVHPIY